MARFSDLPPAALEGVVLALLIRTSPPEASSSLPLPPSALLTQVGRKLSQATINVLYGRLQVVLPVLELPLEERAAAEAADRCTTSSVDSRRRASLGACNEVERARWATVLNNPTRYASAVRSLVVCAPTRPDQVLELESTPVDQGEREVVLRLLRVCRALETLDWRAVAGWGDDVGLALLSLPKLKHISLLPPPLHASSTTTQNADLPRVGLLHALPPALRSLALSRLSAVGHKNLHLHLTTLPAHAPLDTLKIESAMLDDALCDALAGAGRGVRELWLRSGGTKMTDRGITQIFEDCLELESLTLSEVEGRLSRSLWAKIPSFPESFRHLRIEIADVGPHHSWVADHLDSLPSLPLGQLETLSVTRTTPPFALYPISPLGHTALAVDDVCAPTPLPGPLLAHIVEHGLGLRVLEIDWWEVSAEQLTQIANKLVKLERLKVAIDAPFSKLLSLTTACAHLVNLQTLHVIVPQRHIPLPSAAASTVAPVPHPVPPLTPSSSPVFSKALPTPLLHASGMALSSPPLSTAELPAIGPAQAPAEGVHPLLWEKHTDPTLPKDKDVRRFVRRVPRLRELGWVGRGGVGFWLAQRDIGGADAVEPSKGSVGGGRKGSTSSLSGGTSGKALADLEFVSLALLWKDAWEEAGRGPPKWLFRGAAAQDDHNGTSAGGGRGRSYTGASTLDKSLADRFSGGRDELRSPTSSTQHESGEDEEDDADASNQFDMDDIPPLTPVSPPSRRVSRRTATGGGGKRSSSGKRMPPSPSAGRGTSLALGSPPSSVIPTTPALAPNAEQQQQQRSASLTAAKSNVAGSPTYSFTAAALATGQALPAQAELHKASEAGCNGWQAPSTAAGKDQPRK